MGSPGRASQPLGGRLFGLSTPCGRGGTSSRPPCTRRRCGQTAPRSMPFPPRVAGTSAPGPGRSRPSSGRGRCPLRRRGSAAAPHCRTHRTGAGDGPLHQGDRVTRRRQARRSHRRHLRARAHRPRFAPGPHSAGSPGRIHPRTLPRAMATERARRGRRHGGTTRPDVQAAVVVIGRRIRKRGREVSLARANPGAANLTRANLTGAPWPSDAGVPQGWQRDTDSGRWKQADTNSGGAATDLLRLDWVALPAVRDMHGRQLAAWHGGAAGPAPAT
jgi:hypothetical protein